MEKFLKKIDSETYEINKHIKNKEELFRQLYPETFAINKKLINKIKSEELER